MSEPSPIDVVKRLNNWFRELPYAEFHEAMLAGDNFDEVEVEFTRRGWSSVRDLLDPEIEVGDDGFTGAAALPSGRGLDVFFNYWKAWVEPWRGLRWVTDGDYEEKGDWVTVAFRLSVQGELSGAEIEIDVCQLFRVRNGRITSYQTYATREDALGAIEAGS